MPWMTHVYLLDNKLVVVDPHLDCSETGENIHNMLSWHHHPFVKTEPLVSFVVSQKPGSRWIASTSCWRNTNSSSRRAGSGCWETNTPQGDWNQWQEKLPWKFVKMRRKIMTLFDWFSVLVNMRPTSRKAQVSSSTEWNASSPTSLLPRWQRWTLLVCAATVFCYQGPAVVVLKRPIFYFQTLVPWCCCMIWSKRTEVSRANQKWTSSKRKIMFLNWRPILLYSFVATSFWKDFWLPTGPNTSFWRGRWILLCYWVSQASDPCVSTNGIAPWRKTQRKSTRPWRVSNMFKHFVRFVSVTEKWHFPLHERVLLHSHALHLADLLAGGLTVGQAMRMLFTPYLRPKTPAEEGWILLLKLCCCKITCESNSQPNSCLFRWSEGACWNHKTNQATTTTGEAARGGTWRGGGAEGRWRGWRRDWKEPVLVQYGLLRRTQHHGDPAHQTLKCPSVFVCDVWTCWPVLLMTRNFQFWLNLARIKS